MIYSSIGRVIVSHAERKSTADLDRLAHERYGVELDWSDVHDVDHNGTKGVSVAARIVRSDAMHPEHAREIEAKWAEARGDI